MGFLDSLFTTLNIYFLQVFIELGTSYENDMKKPFLVAGIVMACWILQVVFFNNAKNEADQLTEKAKNSLLVLLYKKVSKLSSFSLKQHNLGDIIGLISSDYSTINDKAVSFFGGFFAPMEYIAGGYVIFSRLGLAGGITLFAMIFIIILTMGISKLTVNIRRTVNVHKDQRISLLSEMVGGIKYIKMYGWEVAFKEMIKK